MAVFLGVTTVLSGIVATGLDLSVGGLRPIELMVLAVFAIEFPHAQFFFGINARIMAAVIIGLDLLQNTGDRAWEFVWFTLVTIAIGVVLMRAFGYANDLPWLPRVPLPGVKKRWQHSQAPQAWTDESGTCQAGPIAPQRRADPADQPSRPPASGHRSVARQDRR